MPNIYYCNGLANSDLGRLRAVLSWEECRNLLKLRSEEHTSELQSRLHLVCRLLLEKKNVPRRPGARRASNGWLGPSGTACHTSRLIAWAPTPAASRSSRGGSSAWAHIAIISSAAPPTSDRVSPLRAPSCPPPPSPATSSPPRASARTTTHRQPAR